LILFLSNCSVRVFKFSSGTIATLISGNIHISGKIIFGGFLEIAKIDKKGRILIPKKVRERAELKSGSYVKIRAKEKEVIIEPLEPVSDKYFGIYKIAKWPEDLDKEVLVLLNQQFVKK
jgi:AbrB family looped-hinge helix DNA binding protein